MDYRLPGLDGVQATARGARGAPGRRRRLPHRVRERARDRGALRGRRGRVPDEGPGARRDRRRDPASAAARRVNLTAENTAIVARLDRRLPRRGRSASRTGASCRCTSASATRASATASTSTAAQFYERLRTSRRAADDLAADAGRLPRLPTRSSAAYERILSLHISAKLSGTFESAGTAAARARRRQRAHDRLRDARRPRSRCSRSRSSAGSSAARPTRRSTRSSSATSGEHGLLFTVDTLEFLARGGRIGKAAAFAGDAAARQADPLDPRRRGRAGEARAREPQGVPGVRRRARRRETRDEPALRVGIAHADAPERMAELAKLVRDTRPQAEIEIETTLGAVIGAHAGPGHASASSGSTTSG